MHYQNGERGTQQIVLRGVAATRVAGCAGSEAKAKPDIRQLSR